MSELVTYLRATLKKSCAHHRCARDHDRLRQIRAEHRWKIIRLSAAESAAQELIVAGGGRKSRGRSASWVVGQFERNISGSDFLG